MTAKRSGGAAPAVRARGEAAAQDLRQRGEVGPDAVELLRPAARDAEAGHHFIEDKENAFGVAHRTKLSKKNLDANGNLFRYRTRIWDIEGKRKGWACDVILGKSQ